MSGNGFNYYSHTRLVFGEGAIDSLGELVKEFGGKRVRALDNGGRRLPVSGQVMSTSVKPRLAGRQPSSAAGCSG